MDIVVSLHRVASSTHAFHIPFVPMAIYVILRMFFGVVLPPTVQLGKRVRFAYLGLGTVVHKRVVIADDVVVGPNVTIGGRSGHQEVPVIAAGAFIGAGARILGPVRVGENAVVGANAVVLKDVPANAVVVGIPARVIRENIPRGAFR